MTLRTKISSGILIILVVFLILGLISGKPIAIFGAVKVKRIANIENSVNNNMNNNTDNNGNVYTQSSYQYYSPKTYGAILDGKTDDSISIQKAIDDAVANGGGTVMIDGNANIGTTTLEIKTNVILTGIGKNINNVNPKIKTLIIYNGTSFAVKVSGKDGQIKNLNILSKNSAGNGLNVKTNFGKFENINITGSNGDGTIGIRIGDGKQEKPTCFCDNTFRSVYVEEFKNLLQIDEFSNSNYFDGSNVFDGKNAANYIVITSSSGNYIDAIFEGSWNIADGGYIIHLKKETLIPTGNTINIRYFEVVNSRDAESIYFENGYSNVIKIDKVAGLSPILKEPSAITNKFIAPIGPHLPSSNFIHNEDLTTKQSYGKWGATSNLIRNSELAYRYDAAYGIMPHGWSRQNGQMILSDDETRLFGYRAIKCNLNSNSQHRLVYSLPPDLINLIKGKEISFGIWTKPSDAAVTPSISLWKKTLTNSTEIGGLISPKNTETDWKFLFARDFIPSDATSIDLKIITATEQTGKYFYFALPTLVVGQDMEDTLPKPYSDSGGVLYGPIIYPQITLENTARPNVSGGSYFVTGGTTTITGFTDGTAGQVIYVRSLHNVIFNVTSSNLKGGIKDIRTTSGDLTTWLCADGTSWTLVSSTNQSDDLS